MRIRTILLLIAILFVSNLLAANYYFSSSSGDDSRTSTQAQNSATPWKTLSKLNSFFSNLQPGDNVLFKRGDVFYGSIIITKNGTAALPIIIGAYGSGAKPIITGGATISSWNNIGSNIWESSTSVSTLSTVSAVSLNGVNALLGRYPNSGYLIFQSHSNNSSITSSSLTGSPNWSGAEVVIRKNKHVLDRSLITSQSGSTLNYTGGTDNAPVNGFGFFIQNDIRTLDQQGEWYFNPSTKKIDIYSTSSPANVTLSAADYLVYNYGYKYITFDNLSFQYSNTASFYLYHSDYSTIQNCDFNFSGRDAVWSYGSVGLTIQNCNINNSNSCALFIGGYFDGNSSYYGSNATITNNTVSNSGNIPGMGYAASDGHAYTGINTSVNNVTVTYNSVINTGYHAITFDQNNSNVSNNFIDTFCSLLDDGGGIYTWNGQLYPYTGRKVKNNIVINGIGAAQASGGLNGYTNGIYLDGGSSNVEIAGNTSANCDGNGIYVHNGQSVNIHDNTCYNNGNQQVYFQQDDDLSRIQNLSIKNNFFIAKTASQLCLYYNNYLSWPISSLGVSDNNYWARPINDNLTFNVSGNLQSLSGWQSYTNLDKNSKKSPKTITNVNDLRFEYNATSSSKVIVLGATYIDMSGTAYPGSITLAPYTSTVLIYQSADASSLLPAVNPANTVNGLDYKYYEASGYTVVPNFSGLTPVKTGTTTTFDITLTNRSDIFAFNFTGYINVPSDGQYTFYTNSDDGSNLYIDGVLVVNNDGLHGAQEVSGSIGLQAGKHAISVGFFEQTGDQVLTVSYAGPGISKQSIPASALYRVSPNQSPTANAGPNQTITLPTSTANLAGSGTDPDGSIASYLWTKISGPSPSSSGAITNPITAITSITGLAQGVYQYQLQVTDNGGATAVAIVQITVNAPSSLLSAVNPANTVNGLDYKYYEASGYTVVPNFSGLIPVKTGTTTTFDITLTNRSDIFAFNFTGYINVPSDGQYTFYTNSDDGSNLYIDGVLVVNNDGLHGAQEVSGSIGLQAGKHAISVGFFEQTGDQVLTVSYAGPGISKQSIPASALYRVSPNQSPTANAGPNQTITLPTSTANLAGSGTDPDGSIASYLWTKISGPSPSSSGAITNPISAITSITGLAQGVYQYQLQVTDNGGATAVAIVQITVNAPSSLLSAVNPANTVNGLDYKYYEASGYTVVPNFSGLIPVKTGTTTTFDITLTNRSDIFAFNFTGYINVPSDGQYTFYTNSDDGSNLYIDGVLVVNNDGLHGAQEVSGSIGLQAGKHAISVGFFEQTGDQVLTVSYAGPGISKQSIPASALYRVSPNQSPTANAGPNQTITLPTSTANLAGSGTDPDGSIASYLWTKISGPSPSSSGAITNPISAITSITGLAQGVYQYQLQVTDNGGATAVAIVQITVNAPSSLLSAVNPANTVNGLDYKYYEASGYTVVPNFSGLIPVKTGTTTTFDITLTNRSDIFAFNFTGYINVPSDGQYTFYTNSDDGSNLYIDGVLVVNNDGLHGAQEVSGSIGLQAGKHAISVGFFEQTGDQVLTVSYAGPGVSKQTIPASALYRVSTNTLVNGINYKYYEASAYTVVPNFLGLTPVKTGTTNTFDISLANRADIFAFSFTGYINITTSGVYTFYTNSDDGSNLYIDGVLVVNNDGLHSVKEVSGIIGLQEGLHTISVDFFEQTGQQVLTVSYEGPGIVKQTIPASVLFRDPAITGIARTRESSTEQAVATLTEAKIKVYPNPFTNSILINIPGEAGEYHLTMVDVTGRIVWAKSGIKPPGVFQQSINTSLFEKGIYILKVVQNNTNSVIKLLK